MRQKGTDVVVEQGKEKSGSESFFALHSVALSLCCFCILLLLTD
jgi:hypothetical protein